MGLKALLKTVIGLLVMMAGTYAIIGLRSSVWILIKGSIGPFIFLVGLFTLILGLSEIKE